MVNSGTFNRLFLQGQKICRIGVLAAVVGLATMLIVACTKAPVTENMGDDDSPGIGHENRDSTVRSYLALGDSYTIGESVLELERYPVIAVEILRKKGIMFSAPRIIARTGWTTGELQTAIDDSKFEQSYDIVTLLIGVNNQYRGASLGNYRLEFTKNLETAIKLAGGNPGHVIVLSIPDYGVTPNGQRSDPAKIAAEIDLFNAVNKELAAKYNVNYIDVTADSKLALNDASMVANDQLHFSGKMYRLWAERIAAIIAGIK